MTIQQYWSFDVQRLKAIYASNTGWKKKPMVQKSTFQGQWCWAPRGLQNRRPRLNNEEEVRFPLPLPAFIEVFA